MHATKYSLKVFKLRKKIAVCIFFNWIKVYSKCLNFYLIMGAFNRDIPNDVLPTRLTPNKWLLTLVSLL